MTVAVGFYTLTLRKADYLTSYPRRVGLLVYYLLIGSYFFRESP